MHGTISRVERRYLLMRESNQGALAAGLLFICLLAVGVYSCAVNPVTGRSELALVSFSEEEEAALGAKAYTPAVQQQGGFYRARGLGAYAVLGHERGHVTAKHSLAGYQRALAANVLVTGIVVAAGGRAGVQELSGITASLLENGFSRDQEREADWLGIDYMVKSGYNPEGAVRLQEYFYRQLEGGKNPLFLEGLFRTHPFSNERLDNARARIAQRYPETAKNPNFTFNETIFRQKTARLREVQKADEIADEGGRLFKEKRYDEALAKYHGAARKEPGQAPFHSSAGRVHLVRKEDGLAENELRRALDLDGGA